MSDPAAQAPWTIQLALPGELTREAMLAELAGLVRSHGWLCDAPENAEAVATWLRARGWHVARSEQPWETPAEFCRRVGYNVGSLSRTLARGGHPPVELSRPKMRLAAIRGNPDFEAWLLRRPGAGRKVA